MKFSTDKRLKKGKMHHKLNTNYKEHIQANMFLLHGIHMNILIKY